ncbi:MAG: uracil phosphoribosyltransferase [Spirochaetales bacterium]|nr:MAG: uracil phosphoribosyltransferase [Spirochaetales bacterium]
MSEKIILRAEDLDGYLTESDRENIARMHEYYEQAMASFRNLEAGESNPSLISKETDKIIGYYETMGDWMQQIVASEPDVHVYSFETPSTMHGEVSRLIAKLRDARTGNDEFVYYIQRAYELLFNLAWGAAAQKNKNHLVVKTPVTLPVQNYAVHKIPDVDELINDTVMCVMLRGALLPSMILSKEIQEYSTTGQVTPFALFRICRDDSKMKDNMEYVLDLDMSYFNLEALDGKHLVFADPMNATGGSLVTIVKYLLDKGVRPKSIKALNVIAALQGALQIVRSIDNIQIYTLWMDPILNDSAYILPGLGDAGDRINGCDGEYPRSMIQLVADYGANMASLYRSQVRAVEKTVLGG